MPQGEMMDLISLLLGAFIGAPLGFITAALLAAASRADEERAKYYGKDTH
jgi:gas vesicle protein